MNISDRINTALINRAKNSFIFVQVCYDHMEELLDRDLDVFLETIRNRSVYDFSNYSTASLKRRVNKVLIDSRMNFPQLIDRLRLDFSFREEVVKSITVNTTELFRDPKIWISLKDEVLPLISGKNKLNIWHAGASSGQEVYSMMILLNESGLLQKSSIYVSDLNTDMLDISRKGIYKFSFNQEYLVNFDAVLNTDPNQEKVPYSRYFEVDRLNDHIRMKDFLIKKPVYKKHDLVKDENVFGIIFDLIICRNVIIYFNYDLQNKVFNLFYRNLVNKGALLLGLHESILGPYSSGFEKKGQVYYKIN